MTLLWCPFGAHMRRSCGDVFHAERKGGTTFQLHALCCNLISLFHLFLPLVMIQPCWDLHKNFMLVLRKIEHSMNFQVFIGGMCASFLLLSFFVIHIFFPLSYLFALYFSITINALLLLQLLFYFYLFMYVEIDPRIHQKPENYDT